MHHQAAVLCVLALTAWSSGVAAFQLFGAGAPPASGADAGGSLGETVRVLVRTVDSPDPYFRAMSFFIPKELNYMSGEYLHKNFTRMLGMHCNVTNITMVVRNDVQLLLTDYDVWTMRNGDRVEVWSKLSGSPTRARTAMAFAQKFRRPTSGDSGRGGRGGRGGRWKATGGDDSGVAVPDESAKVEVESEVGLDGGAIVVPDWSQMP